jgi:SAM-dependent methyltransferase
MSITKNIEDDVEFFVPSKGLELDIYLGERLPESASTKDKRLRKQAIHHIARYNWAAMVLGTMKPGRVLDVACGSGYGTYILGKTLPQFEIIGGDYDPRAVEHAKKTYKSLLNTAYTCVDVVSWANPIQPSELMGQFDYIVSFDTLEHLLYRELALINICENLAPAGAFFFSTPVRQENILYPAWEHHKIEYGHRSLYNLMSRFFGKVLVPDDKTLPRLDYWCETVNGQGDEYLLKMNPMFCTEPLKIKKR